MSRGTSADDISALLYLVPFLASGIYGIYLWTRSGFSAILPASVYLTVTREPIVFIGGSLAVMLGAVIELNSSDPQRRAAKVASLANTLQSIAVASLVLVVISSLYANGFLDVSGAATDLILGRYGLVFPAVLVLLSYLISAQFRVESLRNPKTLGVVSMLLVPVSVYELGKRQTAIGLLVALLLLAAGLALFILPGRRAAHPKQELG
jgi:hypothetical protein